MTQQPTWHRESWREFPAKQQPVYKDADALAGIIDELRQQPPLVFAGEVRDLKAKLAKVETGEAFLLQGGDCAEEFNQNHAKIIRQKLRILLQMAIVLTHGCLKPVVKVGRIAGQYAKPRSSDEETIDGVTLPSYRGDSINALAFNAIAREPDPKRMLRAYHQSASTLNLLRAFTHGGYADLSMVNSWNLEFVRKSPLGKHYEKVAGSINRTLQFIRACGIDSAKFPQLHQVDLYTSHEGLLLGYEAALTRCDSLTQDWYNCGAHMIWIGDRTRQVDGAHVEYARGIHNPVGIKVGPTCTPDELAQLIDVLNPHNESGKIVLICRFGKDKIADHLPAYIERVKASGYRVVWSCDPMHGNTFKSGAGYKTRRFEHILSELKQFFQIHQDAGTVPGGVHFELTGHDVTECIGGVENLLEDQLGQRYETACDPRLNAKQSLSMAFELAELIQAAD